ncbi:MAG TPA: hypothetical protein PKD26_02265 [Pyrinomonadaceae bacterium]|nr:hypothetical protein [Pyrinomonadaceae bacterium]
MRMRTPDPNVPRPNIEEILRSSARPAPENSEFSFALLEDLIERRVFKSHPQIAKAEKVTSGTTKRLTVWLRDGRVLEASGDKVEGLSTASSAMILQAVGVESRQGQPTQTSKPQKEPARKPVD